MNGVDRGAFSGSLKWGVRSVLWENLRGGGKEGARESWRDREKERKRDGKTERWTEL